MSLLSFKTTLDTFSVYPSRRLSHDPIRHRSQITPVLSYNDHKYNGQSPFLNFKTNNWLQVFFVKAAALKSKCQNSILKFNAHKLDITSFQSAVCHKCKN